MNKTQKRVLAILLPIMAFVIAFGISGKVLDTDGKCEKLTGGITSVDKYGDCPKFSVLLDSGNIQAFDFDRTWWIWLMALVVTGIAEIVLFKDNKALRK